MFRFFKSPVHICLVGALVLSLGISSLVSWVARLIAGEGGIDLGFLGIFIGLGLLRGSALQRKIFGILVALVLVLIGVDTTVTFFQGRQGDLQVGTSAWSLWFAFLLPIALLLYVFVVLTLSRNHSLFEHRFGGEAPRFVIPVTVVLTLLLSLSYEVRWYRDRENLEEVYRYEVTFELRDSKNGEALERVMIEWSGGGVGEVGVPSWMRSSGSHVGSESSTHTLFGYALKPVEVTFQQEGYQTKFYQITRETVSQVEVFMIPHSP